MSDALVHVDEEIDGDGHGESLTKILDEVIGESHEQALVPLRPIDPGINVGVFRDNALGNGIKWATAQPAMSIEMRVDLVQTGTFYETLYGKSIK